MLADPVGQNWRTVVGERTVVLVAAEATGRTMHRLTSPIDDPRVAHQLRRIALHRETAVLLELRAQKARAELASGPAIRAAR